MGVQNVYARKTRSSSTFILVALCFALFTDTFIYGIVSISRLETSQRSMKIHGVANTRIPRSYLYSLSY
ncbi:hypothetical protein N7497_009259 [Penicillium chrysogenum]|nr:hypothetical protein N7497_009259 [Penicillium chrysogenum]